MNINKQFILLFILVLVIVPLLNTVGCSKAYWAEKYRIARQTYDNDYGNWSWEERYACMEFMGLAAALGDVKFNWLDLPVEEIQVTDTPGETGGHHH